MNLDFVSYTCPQLADQSIDCRSHALVAAFNRAGTLLAIGCLDGDILIYDCIATTYGRTIQAHASLLYSLAWSKMADRILSCSFDGSIALWSTLNSECLFRFNLNGTFAVQVSFHPIDTQFILMDFFRHPSVLLDLNHLTLGKIFYQSLIDLVNSSTDEKKTNGWFSTFHPDGMHLITGNLRGHLTVFTLQPSLTIVQSRKIDHPRSYPLKQMAFSQQLNYFALLSTDRIRLYLWQKFLEDELPACHILCDQSAKNKWMKMSFSNDGEYLCAASAREHRLYLWETYSGTLIRILDDQGCKTISDIVWHPSQPMIISIADGHLYRWTPARKSILYPSTFHPMDENHSDLHQPDLSSINQNDETVLLVDESDEVDATRELLWIPSDPISDEDEL